MRTLVWPGPAAAQHWRPDLEESQPPDSQSAPPLRWQSTTPATAPATLPAFLESEYQFFPTAPTTPHDQQPECEPQSQRDRYPAAASGSPSSETTPEYTFHSR